MNGKLYMCVCSVFNLSLLVGGPMVMKPMAKNEKQFYFCSQDVWSA